jgi:hypothetical protein
MASALSVASLNLLKLPKIACISPEVSFFVVFNGVTVTMFLYMSFCASVFLLGARAPVMQADPLRRRRFKTRVINTTIWGVLWTRLQCRTRASG